MILYFLRHGDAGPPGMDDDETRGLTPAGAAVLRAATPLWRRLNLRPDLVLTSPLPRARQTAEILVEALGIGRSPVADDRLLPGAGWPQLAQSMQHDGAARRVLFVGHEPDLSSVVAQLTGASAVRLRKGGVACVEFPGIPEPGAGELAWLLDPDLYEPAEPR
jgi:phosphohistidine phosphatase